MQFISRIPSFVALLVLFRSLYYSPALPFSINLSVNLLSWCCSVVIIANGGISHLILAHSWTEGDNNHRRCHWLWLVEWRMVRWPNSFIAQTSLITTVTVLVSCVAIRRQAMKPAAKRGLEGIHWNTNLHNVSGKLILCRWKREIRVRIVFQ